MIALTYSISLAADSSVYMANGIKIGEVDSDSAIIWTRLTKYPERKLTGYQFKNIGKISNKQKSDVKFDGMNQMPEGLTLGDMEDSVLGATGEVRVIYWPESSQKAKKETKWTAVETDNDFTYHFKLSGLEAWTRYQLSVEGRASAGDPTTIALKGSFTTAPIPNQEANITLTVVTCGDHARRDDLEKGHMIYKTIKDQIKPHFLVHTGDIEYYDRPAPWAPSVSLARYKMNRLYAMPFTRDLHKVTASYFQKDDHDITKNDGAPGTNFGALTWEKGLKVYYEQFPVGDKPYRTIRWGKDLQIWLVEIREYRSQNTEPDGPEKTLYGKAQKQWLIDTINKSDASYKLLISPTPIVGPDREAKKDNHSNQAFKHEGDEIRRFVASHDNLFIINGDRHWQYYSVDEETGAREFSCGPHSNTHAGGFKQKFKTSEHKFLRVDGGFLSVNVSRQNNSPRITFRHHNVYGDVMNEEIF
ncbi:MAG: alkaline phosphatase D family protein [Verrucomicrobiota bacterium]